MLRRLRIQLTLLYSLAGIFLVGVMGVWMYFRMAGYFESTTDLALKYRLALELRSLAYPVSPELEEAEQEFLEMSENDTPTPTPTLRSETGEEDDDDDIEESTLVPNATWAVKPTVLPRPDSNSDSGTEPEDDDGGGVESTDVEDEDGEESNLVHPLAVPVRYFRATLIPTLEIDSTPYPEGHAEPDLDDAYYSELAPIFILHLNRAGQALAEINAGASPITPITDAVLKAELKGTDLRTVTMDNGSRVRLLTYRVPDGGLIEYIQLGRWMEDQDRLMNQYLMNLLVISLILVLALAIGSWWLAGRTLLPTQRSLEQQQEFVANASHELRTPLTLIRASTELASRGLPPGEPCELLNDVMKDVDYMNKMVEDLLLLSRLDNRHLTFRREMIDLSALLSEISGQIPLLPAAQGLSVERTLAPVIIQADPERLRQVLWILIDNAISHTPAGGKITLRIEQSGRNCEISIQDTGSGISKDDLPHVFDRFYRARESHGRTRGAGLGLSIARSLVTAQGGAIQIDSQPGRGTCVRLTFAAIS